MKQQVAVNISEKAEEFFQDLVENHSMYPDTLSGVVDDFVLEWEMRDRVPKGEGFFI